MLGAIDQQIQALQDNSQAARDAVAQYGQFVESVRQTLLTWTLDREAPALQFDELTQRIDAAFGKAMNGDTAAQAEFLTLLEKRKALVERMYGGARNDDDGYAKLTALEAKFGPMVDAAQSQIRIADDALKVAQQQRDEVSRWGQKTYGSIEGLRATAEQAAATLKDTQAALAGLAGITGNTTGATGGGTAPDKGLANSWTAWVDDFFHRYNTMLGGQAAGTLSAQDAYAQGVALWTEKDTRTKSIPSDPAVWTAMIAEARRQPNGGNTANYWAGIAHDKGIPGFAAGGVVPFTAGARLGQDSVLARLMPYEGVVNHTGMGVLGAAGLAALNAGRPPLAMVAAPPIDATVSFRAPALGGGDGAGLAAVAEAVAGLAGGIEALRGDLARFGQAAAHQRGAIAADAASAANAVRDALDDLPGRLKQAIGA